MFFSYVVRSFAKLTDRGYEPPKKAKPKKKAVLAPGNSMTIREPEVYQPKAQKKDPRVCSFCGSGLKKRAVVCEQCGGPTGR